MKQQVIMLVGNIGSGKSLIARKYAQKGYVIVNNDSIQQSMNGGIYGLYDKSLEFIYRTIESTIIINALKIGRSIVIDRTNMTIEKRKRYFDIVLGNGNISKKSQDIDIICIDFGEGNEPDNIINRMKNPKGISLKTWKDVYQNFNSLYEKPTMSEGFSEIVEFIEPKFMFYVFDFDGTLVENKFPDIGEYITGEYALMIQRNDYVTYIRELYEKLDNVIIIWTCREKNKRLEMEESLIANKVPFDFINENPIFNLCFNKIFAHRYFDDRNCIDI